ncbi:MAG: hypothetical protein U0T81_16200 [Saprospiraceae bacterium]
MVIISTSCCDFTNSEQTVIKDEDLLAAGMRSTGESLFEELFRQCEERQWEHAIGMLTRQEGCMRKS